MSNHSSCVFTNGSSIEKTVIFGGITYSPLIEEEETTHSEEGEGGENSDDSIIKKKEPKPIP